MPETDKATPLDSLDITAIYTYKHIHNGSIYLLNITISPLDMYLLLFFSFINLDVDSFISDILKGENLSKRAKEKRDALIKKIKDVKSK